MLQGFRLIADVYYRDGLEPGWYRHAWYELPHLLHVEANVAGNRVVDEARVLLREHVGWNGVHREAEKRQVLLGRRPPSLPSRSLQTPEGVVVAGTDEFSVA